ncbi:MAG: S9 family peptidase [Chitinophagales bacterium]
MDRFSRKLALIGLTGILLIAFSPLARCQDKPAPATAPATVPLIDRELFFNYPDIRNPKLSPDGKMIAFLKTSKGVLNIWVKNVGEPISKAKILTTSEEPLNEFFWTADSRYILFAHNIWENENYNVYAVDPTEPADSVSGIPNVRNITPVDTVSTIIYMLSKKNPDIAWVGVNNRDKHWFDLYTLEISTGTMKLNRRNRDSISRWIFDWDENPRIGVRFRSRDSTTEILRLNKDGSSSKIFDCSVLEEAEPICFSSDNQWIYIRTNKGEDQDLIKVIMLDPSTMKKVDTDQDPLNKVDLDQFVVSGHSHEPIFTSYADNRRRIYWKDSSLASDYHFLQRKYPGREISFIGFSENDSLLLFSTGADDKLTQVYLFDRNQKQLSLQYTVQNGLKAYESHFSKMEPIVYQSSDGASISGYLTMPKGLGAKNLPVIILPHGGPWESDRWGFNHIVQWLANRGYAVLQMNFRGSAGFGKKFLNAGNKQWGLLIQDDITWGVNELISKGIADPKRIGILGCNFGGYAALAGLTFTSDVYAAGVDINGPSNLVSTYNAIPTSWSGTRKIFQDRVGDISPNPARNLLLRQSPVIYDTSIRSPLLVVYATSDPLVTKIENDQIVATLRDSSRKVEYLTIPGDAYPFNYSENEVATFAKVESFLGRALKGRVQESMKPETAKRLKEIQVDVANLTVGVAMPVTAMLKFPAPSSDLAAGNYNYAILVEVPGRKVPLAMNRLIMSDSANNWVVTDRISGQMGDQSDEATYEKGNLHLETRRTLQRGKMAEYSFNGTEITTTLPDKTSSVSVEGAYLHNGAGMDLLIARLPLREGYESGFYLIGDDGRAKLYQIRVTGRDTINNEPCLKVELTNADNSGISTKMWINMSHKMSYKTIVPLAALPGAKMTIALNQQPSLPKFLLFLWVITPAHGM